MKKTRVKFLQDFRGRETKELFIKEGEITEVDDIWLERLVQDKRIKVMPVRKPKAVPKKVPVIKKKPARGDK